jgi:hypothetical protein
MDKWDALSVDISTTMKWAIQMEVSLPVPLLIKFRKVGYALSAVLPKICLRKYSL